jgi:CRP-like cAMP-binding protein
VAHLHLLHPGASPNPHNRLLAALAPDDLARLRPRLEPVELKLRQILQVPEQPIAAVYFPQTGRISMVALLADGGAAEVGVIGREGMVGFPLLFGADTSSVEAMVQGPGTALRLSTAAFQEELEHLPTLRPLLLRYALAFHEQVTHTAACNGRHALEQRLARWLLIAHDRADGDEFPVTQEFLAMMLCVHRPSVTLAAQLLQQAGYIRYKSGHMAIIDRPGLEAAACECYGTVRRQFERLLGNPTS